MIMDLNQRLIPVTFHELHGQLVAHEILIKNMQESQVANIASRQFALSSSNQKCLMAPTLASF